MPVRLKARATVVSPCCGDAAMALGGSLLAGGLGERPSVVAVFTVAAGKSSLAAEERAACEMAGAEPTLLGFEEQPLRRPAPVVRKEPVFGPLRSALEAIAWKRSDGLPIFPLGIGQDSDHELVHAVAAELFTRGALPRVAFYEDLPEACAHDARAHVLCLPAQLRAALRPIELETSPVADKLDLLTMYASRVTVSDRRLIADHHQRQRHERLWVSESAVGWFA